MRRFHAPSYSSLATFAILASAQLSEAFWVPSLSAWKTSSRAKTLHRRQSDNASVPEAVNIAASQYWEGIDGPWSSFPLQVGTGNVGGLQNVRVMISTAGTAIWTIHPEGCPKNYVADCNLSRGGLFLTNQSLSWAPNSIYETGLESNLGLDSSGYTGYDLATLGWQGSGAEATYEHALIWNLADPRFWTGIFGLNPRPTNFTTFTNPQTSFMQALFDDNQIPSVSWGYTAGNRYRLNDVYGSLTLGGYDANRFAPNDVSFDFYPDISRDLSVYLQSISTDKGSPSDLLPDGSISIFIDSTVPEIWLPESACSAFEEAFGLEYDTDSKRYLITSSQREQLLNQNAKIAFTIGPSQTGGKTVDITLPYQAFDLQVSFPIVVNPNTSYYFPLQRAANDTQYTLGRTFLQEAYLIADYERQNFSVSACSWDQAKVKSSKVVSMISPHTNTTIKSNSKDAKDSPSLSTGAIVGVVVGIVAAIIILCLIARFFWRTKSKEKRRLAEIEEKNAEAAASSATNRPIISRPMGGELGDGEIHEMPRDEYRPELDSPYKVNPNNIGYSEMEGVAKYHPAEMGSTPLYEMAGSDVHEMPARTSRPPRNTRNGWI